MSNSLKTITNASFRACNLAGDAALLAHVLGTPSDFGGAQPTR